MATIITGIIAHAIAIVFLGWYAATVISVPLWIVLAGGTALMIGDFVYSLKKREYTG